MASGVGMTGYEQCGNKPHLSVAVGLVSIMLVLAACGTERDMTGREPDRPGVVSRPALTIHVRLQPSDASLASALGWERGVPGAEVHLLRSGTADWVSHRTDASGQARVVDLLPGLYRVYAGRFMTAGEAAAAELPIRSFADGLTTEIGGGEQSLELELSSDAPGSLVISEISNWAPPPWETGGSYHDAHYFEVYNNSERTLFLDGLVFGGTVGGQDSVNGWCAHSQIARSDSLGVHSFQMVAFPGAGSEYAIGPGETRLVAMSAIDHTPVHPDLPDLSRADFEIRGSRTADNPAVPDMIDVGLQPFVSTLGSSPLFPWKIGSFLAKPVDPRDLPIMYRDLHSRDYVRVPRELLLDVVGRASVNADLERVRPACVPLLHRDFERYEGGFYGLSVGGDEPRLSFQRRMLRSEAGRDILSNSNTSAVDFFLADLTPGVVLWP